MDTQQTPTAPRRLPVVAAILTGAILAGGVAGGGIAAVIINGSPMSATATGSPASATTVSVDSSTTEASVVKVVKAALPSVVTIQSTVRGPFGQRGTGSGSGFIYAANGLILTNNHVVDSATAIKVILADGTAYDGTVVSSDGSRDLAIVKVQATGLPALPLASADAQVGESVIAIGTPLGEYAQTVTTGVISGVNRRLTAGDEARGSETLSGMLQHDAAINPGNSGGPLLDLAGNVIGINTAVAGNAEGIGFAVPIGRASDLIAEARSA
jgi:S1-C subfamily serine protease